MRIHRFTDPRDNGFRDLLCWGSMASLVLITGGARSGKSRMAINMGERLGSRRIFVATCPFVDNEIIRRIKRHKEERAQGGWDTIEEPRDIEAALSQTFAHDVRVVDCLTLWVNNLMYYGESKGDNLDEEFLSVRIGKLLQVCTELSGTVIFVTNEVGSGIVPENHLARCFRDLIGCCSRLIAEKADQVILTVCGLPVYLKKGD